MQELTMNFPKSLPAWNQPSVHDFYEWESSVIQSFTYKVYDFSPLLDHRRRDFVNKRRGPEEHSARTRWMDPADKELLILRRPELVENIDVTNGLFTHLLSRRVLNNRMVQTITVSRLCVSQMQSSSRSFPFLKIFLYSLCPHLRVAVVLCGFFL